MVRIDKASLSTLDLHWILRRRLGSPKSREKNRKREKKYIRVTCTIYPRRGAWRSMTGLCFSLDAYTNASQVRADNGFRNRKKKRNL